MDKLYHDRALHEAITAARRVAAVCAAAESETVFTAIEAHEYEAHHVHLLWLTWVQWRAMGRELMVRETGLTLWTVNERLSRLRNAGVPVCSSVHERDLFARGLFHAQRHPEWATGG